MANSAKQQLPMDEKVEQAVPDGGDAAEALDWRGRPATTKHGGRQTTPYILLSQGLWNVANYAILSSLVLYFVRVLHMSNASAANNVTNWAGTQFLLTLVGGFLGDAYWGRFRSCVVFQAIHLVGLVVLSLTATLPNLSPPVCDHGPGSVCAKPSSLQFAIIFLGLYTIALGIGGYLPSFVAWGADQLDSEIEKTNFFGWLIFYQNAGIIVANTVFVWLQNRGQWAFSFWLATGVGMLAVLAFGAGVPTYREFRPGGNAFTRVAQVLVASVRNRWVKVPISDRELFELPEDELLRQGSRKIPHSTRFRFLDKAATLVDSEDEKGPWRLCNVTQVEEFKCLCKLMPVWMCAIPASAVLAQLNTLFVEQAAMMDLRAGRINIPPASMSVISVASLFCVTAMYPRVFVPLARAITGRPTGMTHLQRLGWGQVWIAAAMSVAAVVEMERLRRAKHGQQMSVFWLAPQQALLGGSQVFGMVGATDFFYTEAPHAMRGTVSSLMLANVAIGSYLSSVVVSVTMDVTSRGGRPGWIPSHDLNVGHVDYFYWLLTGLILLNIGAFLGACRWFRRT